MILFSVARHRGHLRRVILQDLSDYVTIVYTQHGIINVICSNNSTEIEEFSATF